MTHRDTLNYLISGMNQMKSTRFWITHVANENHVRSMKHRRDVDRSRQKISNHLHFACMYPVSWGAPHEATASSQEFNTQYHLLLQLSNTALDFMYVGNGLHLPQHGFEHWIHSTVWPGSTLVLLPALVRLSFFSDSPMEFSLLTQYLKYGRSYDEW